MDTDLEKLAALLRVLRENGVFSYKDALCEVTLGTEPRKQLAPPLEPKAEEKKPTAPCMPPELRNALGMTDEQAADVIASLPRVD